MGDGAFWACEAIFYVIVGQVVRAFSKDLANLLKTFCELVLNTGAFGIRRTCQFRTISAFYRVKCLKNIKKGKFNSSTEVVYSITKWMTL